jgi:hypothetical protein
MMRLGKWKGCGWSCGSTQGGRETDALNAWPSMSTSKRPQPLTLPSVPSASVMNLSGMTTDRAWMPRSGSQ